jgi:hypothetical protein
LGHYYTIGGDSGYLLSKTQLKRLFKLIAKDE